MLTETAAYQGLSRYMIAGSKSISGPNAQVVFSAYGYGLLNAAGATAYVIPHGEERVFARLEP
jgi:hypothetical protein